MRAVPRRARIRRSTIARPGVEGSANASRDSTIAPDCVAQRLRQISERSS
jgi:hypothetical protein